MVTRATPSAELVKLAIQCPKCGSETEQSLAWLGKHDGLACGACGTTIDYKAGDHGAFLKELLSVCDQGDRQLAKNIP